MAKQILILGGYGNLGRRIAEFLLRETKNVIIIIGGKSERHAIQTAQDLSDRYHTERFQARRADASNYNSLIGAFSEIDIVVDAASTLQYTGNIVEAAIGAGIDYLDTHLSLESKSKILKSFEKDIVEQGLCFITDAGAHPGLPAAMVRYAATEFDELIKADVIASIQYNWEKFFYSPTTVADLARSFRDFKPIAFRDGSWRRVKWREFKKLDISTHEQQKLCFPIFLEEMESLPLEIPSLEETGFYYSGFNWFVDYAIMPLSIISHSFFNDHLDEMLGKLLQWALIRYAYPPYQGLIKMEAVGKTGGAIKKASLQISHQNLYIMAAAPVVACILQYLDNNRRVPGLWYQGTLVEPRRFLEDIFRMGIKVEYDIPPSEKTKAAEVHR